MNEKTKDIAERHYRRQNKKKKRFAFFMSVVFILMLFFSLVLASMLTPLFGVRKVEVKGINRVKEEDVVNALGLDSDSKIFTIDKNLMQKRVEALPYVKSAKIRRGITGKLTVEIEEASVSAYIMADRSAVMIDDTGKIINVTSEIPEDIFEIRGCSVTKKTVGEKISIDSGEKFDIILLYMSEFNKAGIKDKMDMIDVSDVLSITGIYDGRYDIMFGDSTDLSHKIAMMLQAIGHNAENEMGTVDLRISGNAYVKPDRTFVKSSVYKQNTGKDEEDSEDKDSAENSTGETSGDSSKETSENSAEETAKNESGENTEEDGSAQ